MSGELRQNQQDFEVASEYQYWSSEGSKALGASAEKPKPELEKQEARISGIQNLLRFLNKAFHTNDFNDYKTVHEVISSIDKDQLKSLLTRINGLVNNIPPADRSQARQSSIISSTEGSVQYVPPPKSVKEQMLEETQAEISESRQTDGPKPYQEIALMIYNLIVYTHLFADGNGRTARLAYTLLTPRKPHFEFADLKDILLNRPKGIQEYHRRLDDSIYLYMLINRGIKVSESTIIPETGRFAHILKHSDLVGFDSSELGFISAYDAMTEEEREQYAHYNESKSSYYFDFDELPPEIQRKTAQKHLSTRIDLASFATFSAPFEGQILEFALPSLDKAWSYNDGDSKESGSSGNPQDIIQL